MVTPGEKAIGGRPRESGRGGRQERLLSAWAGAEVARHWRVKRVRERLTVAAPARSLDRPTGLATRYYRGVLSGEYVERTVEAIEANLQVLAFDVQRRRDEQHVVAPERVDALVAQGPD